MYSYDVNMMQWEKLLNYTTDFDLARRYAHTTIAVGPLLVMIGGKCVARSEE